MMMSLLVTLTLIAQNQGTHSNGKNFQSFAERLKASDKLKKPAAVEPEVQSTDTTATRNFQVRMTQTVAGRR